MAGRRPYGNGGGKEGTEGPTINTTTKSGDPRSPSSRSSKSPRSPWQNMRTMLSPEPSTEKQEEDERRRLRERLARKLEVSLQAHQSDTPTETVKALGVEEHTTGEEDTGAVTPSRRRRRPFFYSKRAEEPSSTPPTTPKVTSPTTQPGTPKDPAALVVAAAALTTDHAGGNDTPGQPPPSPSTPPPVVAAPPPPPTPSPLRVPRPPIVIEQRAEQAQGLWYTRQQGIIKAGDGRFLSPYALGTAQIMQVRDVLKLVFTNLQMVQRQATAKGQGVEDEEKTEEEKTAEEEKRRKEEEELEALEYLPVEERKVKEEEIKKRKEEEERKRQADAAYEEAIVRSKMERFNHRVRLTVYLTRKTPKPRMTDIEEVGVIVLFDKGGDKADGSLYTDDKGLGEWPMLEQGLLKIPEGFKFKGVCICKRANDPPATNEAVMYGYARLDLIPDRLKSTDTIMGMREMKDISSKAAGGGGAGQQSHAFSLSATLASGADMVVKGLRKKEPEGRLDMDKLRNTGFYVRQAELIWLWLKKTDQDKMTFQEFQDSLMHLEMFMLEPRMQRLFNAADLANQGGISISDFQISLMLNDIIPAPSGLMPVDAFLMFDFDNKGEIQQRQFMEILKALGVKDDQEKLEEVFKEADEDGSGNINYEEFKNIFVKVVDVAEEFKKRGVEFSSLLKTKERATASLRQLLDEEEEEMLACFKKARVQVEGVLRQRRLQRDEVIRKRNEERKALKRLEKLTAAYKKRQKEENEKRAQREKAKNRIEERMMKTQLAQEEAALKVKKDQMIRENRLKKEEERIKNIRAKKLDKWDLRHSNFRELPKWVYMGKEAQARLDVVVLLDLSENRITRLPEEGFLFWLNSIRELNLSHNKLECLPEEIRCAAKLEILNLSSNFIKQLPRDISKLTVLKHLDLFKNALISLPEEIDFFWQISHKMNLLDLVISEGDLEQLRVLNLHTNQIHDLPDQIADLAELQRLDLGDNKIRSLPADFSRLMSLTDLDLSSNNINHLPATMGGDLFNLKYLDLSYNQISHLPDSFESLRLLQVFKIKENQLLELGCWIKGMEALIELDATYNVISNISPSISHCTSLQSLQLGNNRLSSLPRDIGLLGRLHRLSLRHNRISTLLPELGAIKSLQDLDLTANHIQGPLPVEVGLIDMLRTLDVSYNKVTSIPITIGNLERLEHFNASNNCITSIPDTLRRCTYLKELNFTGNRIAVFPEVLCSITSLENLNLSSNTLQYLPRSIELLSANLEKLDLSHNRLRILPPEFSVVANKVKSLSLDKNPWDDLPPRWIPKWSPDGSNNLTRSGYTTWDVIQWVHEEYQYFPACVEEWEETGALHFTGRGSLEDFIQGVKHRLKNKWTDRFIKKVSRVYFSAKQRGYMPRQHYVDAEEHEHMEQLVAVTQKSREDKVAFSRAEHERLKERLIEKYEPQKVPRPSEREKMLIKSRFQRAMSHYEVRAERVRREKEFEHAELLREVSLRKERQERKRAENLEAEGRLRAQELHRLWEHSKKTPFW